MFSNACEFIAALLLVSTAFCAAEGEDECQDHIDDCWSYNMQDCAKYKKWSENYCPKTCGYCAEATTTKKPVSACPKNWKHYYGDQSCLIAIGFSDVSQRQPWGAARRICLSHGGDLVIIRDEYKNAFTKAMFPKENAVWTGLRNIAPNANDFTFQFVDGSRPVDYHPWGVGNPDNYHNEERCVTLDKGTTWDGYWNDLACDDVRAFICQKQAIRPTG